MTTTITGESQITLPAELVRELDWKTGNPIEWTKTDDGALVARRKPTRAELAAQLAGRGSKYLNPGSDPIRDLIEERIREDKEEAAQGFA